MAEPTLLTIYEPRDNPVLGLASRKSPVMLEPGKGLFSDISNLRWCRENTLSVRLGTAALAAAVSAGKTVWGGGCAVWNGQYDYQFVGLKDTAPATAKLHVWYTIDGAIYNHATASSAKYGDCALLSESGTDKDCPLSVAVVHDRFTGRDAFVFQNGVDFPVIWPATNASTDAVRHEPITPPPLDTRCKALFYWEDPLDISAGAFTVDDSTTGAGWSMAETGADPNAQVLVGIGTGGGYTGTGKIIFGANKNWAASRQVILGVKVAGSGLDHFRSNAKITVVDSGARTAVIYDGADASKRDMVVVPIEQSNNNYILGLSLEFANATASFAFGSIAEIHVTFNSDTPDPLTGYALYITMVAGSGQVPGGSSYAISYFNSASRSESYEQVLLSKTKGLREMGSHTFLPYDAPFSRDLYYKVDLHFLNTGSVDMGKGVDTLRVYRHESPIPGVPGTGDPEGVFHYCQAIAIAAYSGGWAFSSGTAGSLRTNGTENTASESRLLWLTSPGAYHSCIPIGRAMCSANQRLIVGALDGVGAYPKVAGSRPGNPFRFTTAGYQLDDPETAFEDMIPGESIIAIVASSSSNVGSSTVMIFTNRSIQWLNTSAIGTTAFRSKLAGIGTGSPLSVVEQDGNVFFVDADLLAYRMGPMGIQRISLGFVDDKLGGCPDTRKHLISGAYYDFKYHIAYTPSGGTKNTRKLVWDDLRSAWESDDISPVPSANETCYELLSRFRPLPNTPEVYGAVGAAQLLGFGSNTIPYRLENGVTDLSSDIAVVLTTGDYHKALWAGLAIRRVGFVGEAQAARSLNIRVNYKPTGAYETSSILLTNTDPYTRKWTAEAWTKSGDVETNGVAAQMLFTGNLIGGKQILSLVAEVARRELSASV